MKVLFDLGTAQSGEGLGSYDLVVTNPGPLEGRLTGAFTVHGNVHVTGITPTVSSDTAGVVQTTITGTDFAPGAIARLWRVDFPSILGTDVVVAPNGSSLTARFNLVDQPSGEWGVIVDNPDGAGDHDLLVSFTIMTSLRLTSIYPTLGANNVPPVLTLIHGSGFLAGASARLERAGDPSIPGTVTSIYNTTELSVTFDLDSRPTGFYDVVVENPGNVRARMSQAFEVYAITFTPDFGYDTAVVACTIQGRGFAPNATPRLITYPYPGYPYYPPITGTGTVVASDGKSLTTTFDLRGQPPGLRSVDTGAAPTKPSFLVLSHTIVDAPMAVPVRELALASVAPNPATGPLAVIFSLPSEARVRISVVDLQGREVAVVANGRFPAGQHEARWDARSGAGKAETGMYFVRMEAAGRTFTKRFVLAR
jgi:hypothetical protein